MKHREFPVAATGNTAAAASKKRSLSLGAWVEWLEKESVAGVWSDMFLLIYN